jgi:uncharacterized RDD family membrane protein YckC
VILQQLQQVGGVAKRGEDIEVQIDISDVEAAAGTSKEITVTRIVNVNGKLQQETKQLTVRIPAGAREGQKMRLQGQGNGGEFGGENGDVYVRLSVYETAGVIDDPDGSKPKYEYAPLWKRLFAGVIDSVLAYVCFYVVGSAVWELTKLSSEPIFFAFLSVVIYYFTEPFTKKTLGKKFLGIKLVNKNHESASFGAIFSRTLIKELSIFPGFCIPFIVIFFNKKNKDFMIWQLEQLL